jgi:hypothetical protein
MCAFLNRVSLWVVDSDTGALDSIRRKKFLEFKPSKFSATIVKALQRARIAAKPKAVKDICNKRRIFGGNCYVVCCRTNSGKN